MQTKNKTLIKEEKKDIFANKYQDAIAIAFHKDNPNINKDMFDAKLQDYLMNATLLNLKELIK